MRVVAVAVLLLSAPPSLAGLPSYPVGGAAPGARVPVAGMALPAWADGEVVVRSASGMRLAFRLEGALGVPAEARDGAVRFTRALAIGAGRYDVTLAPVPGGVEDFVHFDVAPEHEVVRYRVDVSAAAGLRLVADTLELLDAHGTPRLRMSAPTVVDAHGMTHAGRVAIPGCAHDADPRGPWGRPVVAPGAGECVVEVRWGRAIGAPIDYPAVLDPAWTDTGAMRQTRYSHFAVLLTNGRVLAGGGYINDSTYQSTVELYDPVSGTWAAAQPMTRPRANTQAVRFVGGALAGKVLVAGGDDQLRPSAESYDSETGTWAAIADLQVPRDVHQVALLEDGTVLAAGGCSRSTGSTCGALEAGAEIFDPETGTWAVTAGVMSAPRAYFTLTALADGRALAAGGCSRFSADGSCQASVASADVFDPASGTWTPVDPMPSATQFHVAVRLGDGSVLAAGGVRSGRLTRQAARFDPETGQWAATGALLGDHNVAAAVLLGSGDVLLTGSWGIEAGPQLMASGGPMIGAAITSPETEVFDPAAGTWSWAPNLRIAHGAHTATLLPDGSVLVTAGLTQPAPGWLQATNVVERFDPVGPAPACESSPALEAGCGRCALASCCEQLAACAADARCTALSVCFRRCGAGIGAKDCLDECAATCTDGPDGWRKFRRLTECVALDACQVPCIETTAGDPGVEVDCVGSAEPGPEAGPETTPEPGPEPEPIVEPGPIAEPEPEPSVEVSSDIDAVTAAEAAPSVRAESEGCGGGGPSSLLVLLALPFVRRPRRAD